MIYFLKILSLYALKNGIHFELGTKPTIICQKRCNHWYCTDWLCVQQRFAHTISSYFKNKNNEHWAIAIAKPKRRHKKNTKNAHNTSMKDDKRLFLPSFWVLSASKLHTWNKKQLHSLCAIYAMCIVLICGIGSYMYNVYTYKPAVKWKEIIMKCWKCKTTKTIQENILIHYTTICASSMANGAQQWTVNTDTKPTIQYAYKHSNKTP